jgi:hypothetical protein
MPVLLDEAMRPVEPLSSWFRHLALAGRSPKTMRKYAYMVLRLSDFLAQRGSDLLSATEEDLLEYRLLRGQVQEVPIGKAIWEVEATAINGLAKGWSFGCRRTRSGNARARSTRHARHWTRSPPIC